MQRHQEAERERQETARERDASLRRHLVDRVAALEETLQGELAQLVLGAGADAASDAARNATRPAHERWPQWEPQWGGGSRRDDGPGHHTDGESGAGSGPSPRGGAEGLAHTLRDVVLVLRQVVTLSGREGAPRSEWGRPDGAAGGALISAAPPRHLPSLLVRAVWALVDGVERVADVQDAAHWRIEAQQSSRALEEVRRELRALHAQQHRLAAQVDTLLDNARVAGQALLAAMAVLSLPWLLRRACLPCAKAARATLCCNCRCCCGRASEQPDQDGRRRRRRHREPEGPSEAAGGEGHGGRGSEDSSSAGTVAGPPPSLAAYKGVTLPTAVAADAGQSTHGPGAAAGGGRGGSNGRFDGGPSAPPPAAAAGVVVKEEQWHTVRKGRRRGRPNADQ